MKELIELNKNGLKVRVHQLRYRNHQQRKSLLSKNKQIGNMRRNIQRVKILIEQKDKIILIHLKHILNSPFSRVYKKSAKHK